MNRLSGAAGERPPHRTLRAASGTIALIVAGAIAVLLLGDALVRAGILEMLRLAPWVLMAVWGVYVLLYASRITFDARGATVQNYLRITRFPWRRVRDIGMRWQVVFTFDDDTTVPAFGGPVAGRPGRAARADRGGGADRRGSGGAARAVPSALRELAELRDAWQGVDSPGGLAADDTAVERSWDVPALIALAVIVMGAVASALSVSA